MIGKVPFVISVIVKADCECAGCRATIRAGEQAIINGEIFAYLTPALGPVFCTVCDGAGLVKGELTREDKEKWLTTLAPS